MKICLAQTKPQKGNIEKNLEQHIDLIDQAASSQPDLIIFPELSLTGYMPSMANVLAAHITDSFLEPIQRRADQQKTIIGIGMPLKTRKGFTISMLFFRPNANTLVNHKRHLHKDERAFFVCGKSSLTLTVAGKKVGLAICYELSITAHLDSVLCEKPDIFIASVAKTEKNIEESIEKLAELARKHKIPTAMVNCVGDSEDGHCVGRSSLWLPGQGCNQELSHESKGILTFNHS